MPLAGGFVATVWTGLLGGQSVVRNLNQIHSLREERSRLRVAVVALTVSLASSVAAVLAVVVILVGSMEPEDSVSGLGIGEGARYGLRGTREAAEGVEELRAGLEERDIDRIVDGGLHEFLDWVQRMLIAISGSIGTAFFRDWRPDATQSQEQ